MVVPAFGWSVGDIAVSTRLLINIGKALKGRDGATAQYQEAVDFLSSLKKTRELLDKYATTNPDATYSRDLINHLRTVQKPWDTFNKFLSRFEKSLAADSEKSRFARAPRSMQWAVKELDGEIQKLKTAVSQPLHAINLLLALQLLELLGKLPERLLTPTQCTQLIQAIHLADIPAELGVQIDALKDNDMHHQAAHESQSLALQKIQQSLLNSETKIREAINMQSIELGQLHVDSSVERNTADATVLEVSHRLEQSLAHMQQELCSSSIKRLIEEQHTAILAVRLAVDEKLQALSSERSSPGQVKRDTVVAAGRWAAMLLATMTSSIVTGVIVGRSTAPEIVSGNVMLSKDHDHARPALLRLPGTGLDPNRRSLDPANPQPETLTQASNTSQDNTSYARPAATNAYNQWAQEFANINEERPAQGIGGEPWPEKRPKGDIWIPSLLSRPMLELDP